MGDFTGRRPAVPPGIPRIARRHPLAAGLAFLAWSPTPGVMLDLVSSALGAATAPTPGMGAFGPQTSFLGSTSWMSWPWVSLATTGAGGTGDFTVAAAAAPTGSAPNTASLFQFGGTSNLVRLQLNTTYLGATSAGIFSMQTYSGTSAGANSNGGVNGQFALFLGRRQGGSDAVFFNGAPATTSGSTGDTNAIYNPGGPSAGTYVGNLPNTGYECLCPVVWVAAWNRALANAEIAAWFGNAGNAEPLAASGLLEWPWDRLPTRSLPALNLTTDRWAPLESAHSFTERETRIEFGAATAADQNATAEYAGSAANVAIDRNFPIELLAGAAVAPNPPIEPLATQRSDQPPLVEAGASLATDRSGPIASAASIACEPEPTIESTEDVVTNRGAPTQSVGSFEVDAMLPTEEHGATDARVDQGAPIESLATAIADWRPIEWVATFRREISPAVETAATQLGRRSAAAESMATFGVGGSAAVVESGRTAATQQLSGLEMLLSAMRDGALIEATAVSRGNVVGIIEWAALSASDRDAAIGWARRQIADPISNTYAQIEWQALPPVAIKIIGRGNLLPVPQRTTIIEGMNGMLSPTPFTPIAPGEALNLAFDFSSDVGAAASIVTTKWSCALLPQWAATNPDPAPQSHVLSVAAQTEVGSLGGPLYFPLPADVVVPLSGAFSVARIGDFAQSASGATYLLTATVVTSDGRTLSASADLPVR